MGSSATIRTDENSSNPYVIKNEPSKCKTIGFAIVIILGLGGLAVAGVGLSAYLQAGSLSSLGQVNSIIMMAAGGGGGIVFLIIGIVGSVKNRQQSSHIEGIESGRSTTGSRTTIKNTGSGRPTTVPLSIETPGGKFFGPEAYGIWHAQVVGSVEDVPKHLQVKAGEKDPFFGQLVEENFPLLYIPEKVLWNGKEVDLTLNTLQQISGKPFHFFSEAVRKQFGDIPLQSGWRRMSRDVIPDSRSKTYDMQKGMVEGKGGYCLPHALEVAIFMQLVEDITGEKLYGTFTRCIEIADDKYPVVVGGSGPLGFDVDDDCGFGVAICRVGAVRK